MKNHYENIDMLRGFAAISVLICHYIELLHWESFPTNGPLIWFRVGWIGVDIFFVISGFVIGLSAFKLIDQQGHAVFRKEFAVRRLARIVPLHYLTLLIFVTFLTPSILWSSDISINFVLHLLFLHNLFPNYHGAINGSNWSLGTEMQFYLLILMIGPWIKGKRIWIISIVALCITWIWRFSVTQLIPPTDASAIFKSFMAITQLPGMLDEFLSGILIAIFIRSNMGKKLFQAPAAIKLGFAALAIVSFMITMGIFFRNAGFWNNAYMVIFWRTMLAASTSLILLALIYNQSPKFIYPISIPAKYLGKISYGIYLWHLPILLAIKNSPAENPLVTFLSGLIITLIFAALSWHFIEQPIVERFASGARLMPLHDHSHAVQPSEPSATSHTETGVRKSSKISSI